MYVCVYVCRCVRVRVGWFMDKDWRFWGCSLASNQYVHSQVTKHPQHHKCLTIDSDLKTCLNRWEIWHGTAMSVLCCLAEYYSSYVSGVLPQRAVTIPSSVFILSPSLLFSPSRSPPFSFRLASIITTTTLSPAPHVMPDFSLWQVTSSSSHCMCRTVAK